MSVTPTRLQSLVRALFLSLAIFAFSPTPSANAHSWVRCTDYRVADPSAAPQGPRETDPLRRNYDEAACQGYAPDFPPNTQFGQDTGYEHRPGGNQLCLDRSNTYSNERPMATYMAGQTVCLAYPAKNHVADTCTNQYIPDAGVKLYRSSLNAPSDRFAPMSDFQANELQHLNGEHTLNTVDYLGFQNCPDFCGDGGTDRVLCTMCFNLESDLTPGMYQFAWDWEFNVGERYSTCWSAQVLADDGSGGTPVTPVNPDNGAGGNPGNPDNGAGGNPGNPDNGIVINPGSPNNGVNGVESDGNASDSSGRVGVGAAVGITLVVVLVVAIGFAVVYNMWWKKRRIRVWTPSEYSV